MDAMHDPFAPLPEAPPLPPAEPAPARVPGMLAPATLPLPEVIRHRQHGTASLVWHYRDAAGALLFAVVRFDKPGGGKEVLPYSPTATGWAWKAPPAPRPLYGLHDLAQRPAAPVLLVEGEKAAEAAAGLFPGHVAMTWQGGAQAIGKADLTSLTGRGVTLWPDNDAAGRDCMEKVARLLHAAGAASVALVAVPDTWPAKWDVADPLPEGVTLDDLAALLAAAEAEPAPGNSGAATGADDGPMTTEERAAAIKAFTALPATERAAQRAAEAVRLGMTRTALDQAVKVQRATWRAEAEATERARPEPGPGEVRWPPMYAMHEDGLYADAGDDAPPVWLAAPFMVLGEARNAASEGWAMYLRWRDRAGVQHSWPLPRRMLVAEPGALEAELENRGLRLSVDSGDRMHLRRALSGMKSGDGVQLAQRAGWHGSAFLLPDGEVVGASAEALVLDGAPEDAARLCATAGTLDGWRDGVAALAVGNPLAAFCTAAAFCGPLLLTLGEPGGGFHLTGASKRGKTTATLFGLSVWGRPDKAGALHDWNGTANAFEATAEAAGDMLLVLDELHQANPADVARIAYALADGAGKGRLNRNATARRRRTWRSFILSTGEHDLATAAARAGQRLPAGADVRLPSLLVPDAAEGWPALHGRANLQTLWGELHQTLKAHHGTAARGFLTHLVAADAGDVQAVAAAMRDRLAATLPADADPQVREVARRFALVATAGTLATAWGVLPWPEGEAEAAALAMLQCWLARRPGGAGSGETAAQLERVRLFLALHGAARFVALTLSENGAWIEANPDRPVPNRAGWRKPRKSGGADEFLIPPEVWRAEVCAPAGLDPQATARTLIEAGALRRPSGATDRLTVRERVPGVEGPASVYAISASLLEAPAEDERQ